MKAYVKLLRIEHSVKNLLIFSPLFFSRQLFEVEAFTRTVYGFLAFSFMAFTVYIINDIHDVDYDRQHHRKCHRPIASGAVSVGHAYVFALCCFLVSSCFMFLARSGVLVLVYLLLNLLYSHGLKNIPLLDIIILVSGFLLRVVYGGLLCGVEVSDWLYLTVMSASFYMGIGKRRNELKNRTSTREVLSRYTYEFLDKNMYMFLALLNVFYALWALSSSYKYMIWTVLFVMIISMKYSMDLEQDREESPVEIILHDKVILGLGVIWWSMILYFIYF